MLAELPRSVFVLKVGDTYYTEYGTLRAFLDEAQANAYKGDVEPFSDSSLGVVEVPLDVVYLDVSRSDDMSHLYLVLSRWSEEGVFDLEAVWDPAATIN